MRIISKFHDYYDGPATTLFGQEPLFVRTTAVLKDAYYGMGSSGFYRNRAEYYNYNFNIVFCGVLYILRYRRKITPWRIEGYPTEYLGHEIGTLPKVSWVYKDFPCLRTSPIWSLWAEERFVITNHPRLLDMGFQKVFDAYTAAQELDRFLTNLAQPVEVPKPVSDNVKIESHGFDLKTSFRKGKANG